MVEQKRRVFGESAASHSREGGRGLRGGLQKQSQKFGERD